MNAIFSLAAIGQVLLGLSSSTEALVKQTTPATAAQSVSSQVALLNGTWEGSYTCGQGLTRLTLVIEAKSTTDIDAVFMFSEHPQNTGVPSGRFRMIGDLEVFDSPDIPNLLNLEPTTWINRPSGYSTVGLQGDVSSSNRRITGNVTGSSACTTFNVIKREKNSRK